MVCSLEMTSWLTAPASDEVETWVVARTPMTVRFGTAPMGIVTVGQVSQSLIWYLPPCSGVATSYGTPKSSLKLVGTCPLGFLGCDSAGVSVSPGTTTRIVKVAMQSELTAGFAWWPWHTPYGTASAVMMTVLVVSGVE